MSAGEVKAQAQARFGQFAQNYVDSPTHASTPELDRLVELVAPQSHWLGLDVATGGGHTALKFAPHVRHMVASDFGLTMLNVARDHIHEQGVTNVSFTGADAESLPFAGASFDVVTCRIAPHHFPDAFEFVQEAARVLKPGGVLAVQDHLAPEDARAAAYIDAFNRLRDPSHHRAFNEWEWRGMLLDAGLDVTHVEQARQPTLLASWAERQGSTPQTVEYLRIMLAQAPQAVADWLRPRHVLSPDAAFDHVYILITGKKPG
jgi:ubiquinone/menaquinone biosynthesis C-methylase UbiE